MKIAVTSQNFRTITGHAGKTRRFLVYSDGENGELIEHERIDLPKEMSMHEFQGGFHPVFEADVLITAGCGQGFIRKMAGHNVQVIATSESDPQTAAKAAIAGQPLPPAEPHEH